ncbi:hypothetical protein HDU79_010656 [Rhizoclosmatium sp. JEL0117]|nr:hypothetical protein HDU79_010656 [Rhizoclosmatium sp. JEL0117]
MTYYTDLGIDASANLETIKRHYVRTAYDNSFNKDLCKHLAIAFLVLTTDRSKYDAFLRQPSSTYTIPSNIQACDPQTVFEAAFNDVAQIVEVPVNKDGSKMSSLYTVLGTISGGMLGFIVGGPVGAVGLAVAGGAAGNMRDVHGKSAYEVFLDMEEEKRKEIMDRVVFAAGIVSRVL